ncbi:hypothetical protein [Photobacterium damselae]|uniref:hypothetical protein n=1 Tax=Photobacterium damselae TaxID=38293 RepID=UPI001F323533|nr:hypothetical protein [Photobacterium damselae]UKA04839.1 hypothetical protein IHC89_21590 [Photobacterium damselae subsp. damselae]
MIDLNEDFSNPKAIEISKKLLVIADSWSKDQWMINNPLATIGSYKLVWRSLVGGYECILMPLISSEQNLEISFLEQQQVVKKAYLQQAETHGGGKVDWEVFIANFVAKSQCQGSKLFSSVKPNEVPSIIWGFVAGFMELYPDEVYIDHLQKVVLIDKPLYNYVVEATDAWMLHEIARLSSKMN